MILVLRYYNQVTSENVLTLPPTVFPGVAAGKVITCDTGDLGSIPGLGRPPGEGKGYPLQYSGLENSMDCISPQGHIESGMTERLSLSLFYQLIYSNGTWYNLNR